MLVPQGADLYQMPPVESLVLYSLLMPLVTWVEPIQPCDIP